MRDVSGDRRWQVRALSRLPLAPGLVSGRAGQVTGTEWNGMERDGTEWNGMERNGTEWNGMERNGTN